ncbi:unnamed protein product [Pieris brassicae]|uniref:Uncharacterized protein n=1 Tax=Pieris brassicae TaxID=7116 RepID=A0A9P0TT89_PIEBR|nr:unnamed protein product [Pieris brassicae]
MRPWADVGKGQLAPTGHKSRKSLHDVTRNINLACDDSAVKDPSDLPLENGKGAAEPDETRHPVAIDIPSAARKLVTNYGRGGKSAQANFADYSPHLH